MGSHLARSLGVRLSASKIGHRRDAFQCRVSRVRVRETGRMAIIIIKRYDMNTA